MSGFALFSDYIPVPKLFRSDITGDLIPTCIDCDKSLLVDGTQYLIEKAFKRIPKHGDLQNTIFEYAICRDCADKMHKTISPKSKEKISEYFEARVNLKERREMLLNEHEYNMGPWLEKCLVTGQQISECDEYQVFCQCDGRDMMFSYLPYALSGAAIEDLQEVISPETKEELDRFSDDILGVPPELKELFEDRPLVLV